MNVKAMIVVILSFIVVMTPMYLWYYPNVSTQAEKRRIDVKSKTNKTSYYGTPNGDFDWCEFNYFHTNYVAEPWNTISSLIYTIIAIFDIQFYLYSLPNQNYHVLFVLFCQIMIGLGSTSFHATLRYDKQLFDEIPMQYYVSIFFAYVYCRHSTKSQYLAISLFMLSVSIALTIIILNTDRDDLYHYIAHCILMASFGLFMGLDLIIALLMYNECRNETVAIYAKWSVLTAVIGLIFWQFDNLFCQYLQNLPYNLPYPHFHAIWHISSALSCHYFFLTVVGYETIHKYRVGAIYHCSNFIIIPPYFCIEKKESRKKQ